LSFELTLFNSSLIPKQTVTEIIKLNDDTARYGLVLTERQAIELVETRNQSLKAAGRIELGNGIIDKLINAFCDSPYISLPNYAETLHELLEMFYYFKNETIDLISDDKLIEFMKTSFDGVCQGSLDLLSGRELDRLARNLRNGRAADYSEDTEEASGEEDDNG
jgi:hypothetical protein